MSWRSLIVFLVSLIWINRKKDMYKMMGFTISQTCCRGWQKFFECRYGLTCIASSAELFYVGMVILSINIMRNVLGLVLERMKYVIKFIIYVFFAYHVLTFYYPNFSFTILCIYVITLCLVSNSFTCSIKFIYDYYLPNDSLLYMSLSTIILM